MEIEGVVNNGAIVPDDATALPEGIRVRITPAPLESPKSFGERFAQFKGCVPDLPADLAEQHDHYRLGTSFKEGHVYPIFTPAHAPAAAAQLAQALSE
jgi:hypothetical protein